MKRYQKIFAVLFLLLLLPFSILNFFWERGAIRGGIVELEKPKKAAELKEYMQSVDGLITKNIAGGASLERALREHLPRPREERGELL